MYSIPVQFDPKNMPNNQNNNEHNNSNYSNANPFVSGNDNKLHDTANHPNPMINQDSKINHPGNLNHGSGNIPQNNTTIGNNQINQPSTQPSITKPSLMDSINTKISNAPNHSHQQTHEHIPTSTSVGGVANGQNPSKYEQNDQLNVGGQTSTTSSHLRTDKPKVMPGVQNTIPVNIPSLTNNPAMNIVPSAQLGDINTYKNDKSHEKPPVTPYNSVNKDTIHGHNNTGDQRNITASHPRTERHQNVVPEIQNAIPTRTCPTSNSPAMNIMPSAQLADIDSHKNVKSHEKPFTPHNSVKGAPHGHSNGDQRNITASHPRTERHQNVAPEIQNAIPTRICPTSNNPAMNAVPAAQLGDINTYKNDKSHERPPATPYNSVKNDSVLEQNRVDQPLNNTSTHTPLAHGRDSNNVPEQHVGSNVQKDSADQPSYLVDHQSIHKSDTSSYPTDTAATHLNNQHTGVQHQSDGPSLMTQLSLKVHEKERNEEDVVESPDEPVPITKDEVEKSVEILKGATSLYPEGSGYLERALEKTVDQAEAVPSDHNSKSGATSAEKLTNNQHHSSIRQNEPNIHDTIATNKDTNTTSNTAMPTVHQDPTSSQYSGDLNDDTHHFTTKDRFLNQPTHALQNSQNYNANIDQNPANLNDDTHHFTTKDRYLNQPTHALQSSQNYNPSTGQNLGDLNDDTHHFTTKDRYLNQPTHALQNSQNYNANIDKNPANLNDDTHHFTKKDRYLNQPTHALQSSQNYNPSTDQDTSVSSNQQISNNEHSKPQGTNNAPQMSHDKRKEAQVMASTNLGTVA